MEERTRKEDEVTILDKNETSDRAVSVVGGFVIEESVTPFPVRRGRLCVCDSILIQWNLSNKGTSLIRAPL